MVRLRIFNFKYLLVLAMVLLVVACSGGGSSDSGASANNILGLSWVAPSERVDNTSLALSEIASYHIYYGTETGDYQNQFDVNDGSAVAAQIVDVPSGTYYIVLTTVDTEGRESSYSSEIVVTI